ncbi:MULTISPECIES: PilZ domain-containing protein [unclassified Chelatococcus]|uniref:PilZ domain-containing protein n=1 Tax=unclassified Chelatococcus TaxID=2638111 RepID=UPI001BCC8698|nr:MULTISPECIES: PilZ domain-containing protein [unclassified Chelatococcus]MBS7738102.1 PilZ domain-containing protein [Chelatococcus sp. HY11]MBX3546951.1 PilZ domain-containing protein [Chelatococcus sp.]MCO5077552.1 PilZ domain-containing protein [Chelatococcus sp.]CAH1668642.1 PilZ domain-containing protein [Hyphomicrobiales bacterium]
MAQAATEVSPPAPAENAERRRFERLKITLLGRYMIEGRHEFPCQTIDMSPADIHVVASDRGEIGEHAVLYLDHLGRVEGHIVRHSQQGFVLTITATPRKREKIAAQMTSLANREPLKAPEVRRHERVLPTITGIGLTLPDGSRHHVHIMDISHSGAALLASVAPEVGSPVIVGRTSAKVIRHFNGGFAVEFGEILGKQDFARIIGPGT